MAVQQGACSGLDGKKLNPRGLVDFPVPVDASSIKKAGSMGFRLFNMKTNEVLKRNPPKDQLRNFLKENPSVEMVYNQDEGVEHFRKGRTGSETLVGLGVRPQVGQGAKDALGRAVEVTNGLYAGRDGDVIDVNEAGQLSVRLHPLSLNQPSTTVWLDLSQLHVLTPPPRKVSNIASLVDSDSSDDEDGPVITSSYAHLDKRMRSAPPPAPHMTIHVPSTVHLSSVSGVHSMNCAPPGTSPNSQPELMAETIMFQAPPPYPLSSQFQLADVSKEIEKKAERIAEMLKRTRGCY